MNFARCLCALAATILLGAAPTHVLTGDYFGGYAGTKVVPPQTAARWLSWAETNPQDSATMSALGVRTILYSNPHRAMPGDAMYTGDESSYAHDCGGARVPGEIGGSRHTMMMNIGSGSTQQLWKKYVARHDEGGAHYAAVFEDEAVGDAYAGGQPCGFTFANWLNSTIAAQRDLGYPVIYNGLSDFYDRGIAREIGLNASAIGGMMEECYAQLGPKNTRSSGWRWTATEQTELRMARDNKYFFCYGRDLTPADQGTASRLYTYGSFLLTYDPHTSVIWEYYKTPSGGHVMPESQLVATDPVIAKLGSIEQLRSSSGLYTREYRRCSIAGKPEGPCMVAVNPDPNYSHTLALPGFRRTIALHGSGVFDGGTISIDGGSPPQSLGPLEAVIGFR